MNYFENIESLLEKTEDSTEDIEKGSRKKS